MVSVSQRYNELQQRARPVPVEVVEKKKEPEKEVLQVKAIVYPKYDLFRAPVSLFDWSNAGMLFKAGLHGRVDEKQKQLFADLCDKYEIQNFYIDSNTVYFLFKLK